MSTDKSMFEKASDAVTGGLDSARGAIHDMTKTQEQKDAEKPIGERVHDMMPKSAEDAGKNVGGMVDQGTKAAKEKLDEMNKKS